MAAPHRKALPRLPSYLFPSFICLLFLPTFFLYQVDRFASETKTIAGHNLDPTPWHLFPTKNFNDQSRHVELTLLFNVLISPAFTPIPLPLYNFLLVNPLRPVALTFSDSSIAIWNPGPPLMMERYPGLLPDVDLMFDCMDRPKINRTEHNSFPLPLFRYCTTKDHFDIPFPDWSFWGWPEINIRPWNEEFLDIKRGSQSKKWSEKKAHAFWKGNPEVMSEVRTELLQCNDTRKWGALIMRQDWGEEAQACFEHSKLSNQCGYRYKIYAEGFARSVSLKYIVACGSLTLIITPKYEDFFSRGLIPKKNYWPVSSDQLCHNIKSAVEWGNANSNEASEIGKGGQDFMESLSMDRVYDYMFHLIKKYAELLKFQPIPPPNGRQVCGDSILCFGDEKQKEYLKKSSASPSPSMPCTLQPADANVIQSLLQEKERVIKDVKEMAMPKPIPIPKQKP